MVKLQLQTATYDLINTGMQAGRQAAGKNVMCISKAMLICSLSAYLCIALFFFLLAKIYKRHS